MKKITCFTFSILLVFCLAVPMHASENDRKAFALLFPRIESKGILTQTGENVRILEAEDKKHFVIVGKNGLRRTVAWDALIPQKTIAPKLDAVDGKTVSYFAGAMGLHSKTDYLIWTDLSRLKTYVLEYGDEGWHLLRALPCSVGDSYHPTPSGTYEVDYKCTCIGKEEHYLCRYALCFYGSYMYHSVLYDWGGEHVIDERLGERISHGCIRLSPADSKWLYTTVPVGSTVFIR